MVNRTDIKYKKISSEYINRSSKVFLFSEEYKRMCYYTEIKKRINKKLYFINIILFLFQKEQI